MCVHQIFINVELGTREVDRFFTANIHIECGHIILKSVNKADFSLSRFLSLYHDNLLTFIFSRNNSMVSPPRYIILSVKLASNYSRQQYG